MRTHMGVFLLSVYSLCTVAVLAVAPCDQNIINNLRAKSSCYSGGVPPKITSSGNLGTPVHISSGELPANTQCVTSYSRDGEAHTTIYMKDGTNIPVAYTQYVDGDHIMETGKVFQCVIIATLTN